jgi:hypothetical protein
MSLLALLQPPISVMNPARTSPRELRAGLSPAAPSGTRLPVAGQGMSRAGRVISLPASTLWIMGGIVPAASPAPRS